VTNVAATGRFGHHLAGGSGQQVALAANVPHIERTLGRGQLVSPVAVGGRIERPLDVKKTVQFSLYSRIHSKTFAAYPFTC